MKHLLLIGAAILAIACTNKKNTASYNITVNLQGDSTQITSDSLMLTNYQKGEDLIKQTVAIKNGKAVFTGTVTTPEMYYMAFPGKEGNAFARLFVENENYVVDLDFTKIEDGRFTESISTIKGGKTQGVIDSLENIMLSMQKEHNFEALIDEYQKEETTAERREEIIKINTEINKAFRDAVNNYVKLNPTSLYALYKLNEDLYSLELDDLLAAFEPFAADTVNFKENRIVKKIASTIEGMKALENGKVAPDFEQAAPDGTMIKFSDVYSKNKVTMLDFWASWCGPCRAFNPTLVRIYKKYHSKGFEVLGVSFDTDKARWEDAIKKDGLTWPHVSDLKGWENAAGTPYMVKYIPQNVLVDQSGTIIKRRATEEEIEQILSERL